MRKAVMLLTLVSTSVFGQFSSEKFIEKLRTQEFSSILALDSTFEEFNKLGLKNDSKFVAEANYIFGKKYFSKSVLDKSLAFLLKAKGQLEIQKMNRELADTYHFLGLNYYKTSQKNNAILYFNSCEKLAIATKDTFNMINALHGLGRINLADSLFNKAEMQFTKAMNLGIMSRDLLSLSYSYDFLSQLTGVTNKKEIALDYQLKAMKIREKLNDKYALAISINNVGETYRLLNDDIKAEQYFLKALTLCKSIGFRDLESYIYSILIDFAKKRKQFELALDYAESQRKISESIFSENMTKSIAEVQGKYELAKKNREIAKKEIEYQNQKIISLIVLFSLIMAIGTVFFVYKRKQSQKTMLEAITVAKLEKERIRIARDLHDNLGPELTHVTSKLDLLSYKSDNAEKENFAFLANATRGAMDQLRDTIWSIRGEAITLADFTSKVNDFALKRLTDLGIAFQDTCIDTDVILGPSQALSLFRLCQEGINNVAKYAAASNIRLEIFCNDAINIKLIDNGKGFELKKVKHGYGLSNMQERVKELGGEFALNSSNKGTEISISVPFKYVLEI